MMMDVMLVCADSIDDNGAKMVLWVSCQSISSDSLILIRELFEQVASGTMHFRDQGHISKAIRDN